MNGSSVPVWPDWVSKRRSLPASPPPAATATVAASMPSGVVGGGVSGGQYGVDVSGAGLPVVSVPDGGVWLVGVHGGSGESTLAGLAGFGAGGHAWPVCVGGQVSFVVLVARSNVAGLDAARRVLAQWAGGLVPSSVRLAGLLVSADAPGRLPHGLARQVRVAGGGAGWLGRVGWVEAWRYECPPVSVPSSVSRVFTEIRSVVSRMGAN